MQRRGTRVIGALLCAALLLAACGAKEPTWQEQYDLGVRYLSEGNYEEAVVAFTAAIEIDPLRAEAYVKLGDTYVALGNSESALEVLRQGSETLGDGAFFQDYINELTAEVEQSPGSSVRSTTAPSPGFRVERNNTSDGSHWLDYYDAAGNRTRTEFYNPDDTMDQYLLFYYDEEGNQTREERYYPDGTLDCIRYFDEAGNETRYDWYLDGTMEGYFLNYYDEEGKRTREEDYIQGGTLLVCIFYYDEAEKRTRCENYGPDGMMESYVLYYYDAAGNRTREELYNPDGTPLELEQLYIGAQTDN